jgi:hypothetical protein
MTTLQMLPIVITASWAALEFVSLFAARRKRIHNRPDISKRLIFVLIAIESLVIGIALLTNGDNKYVFVAGIFMLIIGWLESHRFFLQHIYNPKSHHKMHIVLDWIYRLLGRRLRVRYKPLLGDWIQLLGFGLLWSSAYAFIFALIAFPVIVSVIDRMQARQLKNANELATNWRKSLNAIWPGSRFAANVSFIVAIPIILISVIARDLPIFWGATQDSATLMATLAQVEATVGTLVFTLLFILVQFTTSTYSPRLTKILAARRPFRVALIIAVLSITAKFLLLSSIGRLTALSNATGESAIIDGALLSSVLTALAYWVFARDTFEMLSPEAIARAALKKFDTEWMQIIRDEWSSRKGPRSMYIDRDPLILVERILMSALEHGDINSFQTSLMQIRDAVQEVRTQHDGPVLDTYFSNRLETVIRIAAQRHADIALEFFCDAMEELVAPSSESLASADIGLLDTPLGNELFRQILEQAINFQLSNSAKRAINTIDRLGIRALAALPKWSDLWLLNKENHAKQLSESEQNALWRNDWRLDNYVTGYLDYFSEVAQQVIEANMIDVSWALSNSINRHIGTIIKEIQEEQYQFYLLNHALIAIDRIIDAACMKKISEIPVQLGPLSFGTLSFSVEAIISKNVAVTIVQWLARYIVRLAKAYILNDRMVVDVSVATVHLAKHNPEVVLPIIEAFGEAGEALRTREGFSGREYLIYVHKEILQRIKQIEDAGSRGDMESKVRAAAQRARSRAQLPQSNKVGEDSPSQQVIEQQPKKSFSTLVHIVRQLIRLG